MRRIAQLLLLLLTIAAGLAAGRLTVLLPSPQQHQPLASVGQFTGDIAWTIPTAQLLNASVFPDTGSTSVAAWTGGDFAVGSPVISSLVFLKLMPAHNTPTDSCQLMFDPWMVPLGIGVHPSQLGNASIAVITPDSLAHGAALPSGCLYVDQLYPIITNYSAALGSVGLPPLRLVLLPSLPAGSAIASTVSDISSPESIPSSMAAGGPSMRIGSLPPTPSSSSRPFSVGQIDLTAASFLYNAFGNQTVAALAQYQAELGPWQSVYLSLGYAIQRWVIFAIKMCTISVTIAIYLYSSRWYRLTFDLRMFFTAIFAVYSAVSALFPPFAINTRGEYVSTLAALVSAKMLFMTMLVLVVSIPPPRVAYAIVLRGFIWLQTVADVALFVVALYSTMFANSVSLMAVSGLYFVVVSPCLFAAAVVWSATVVITYTHRLRQTKQHPDNCDFQIERVQFIRLAWAIAVMGINVMVVYVGIILALPSATSGFGRVPRLSVPEAIAVFCMWRVADALFTFGCFLTLAKSARQPSQQTDDETSAEYEDVSVSSGNPFAGQSSSGLGSGGDTFEANSNHDGSLPSPILYPRSPQPIPSSASNLKLHAPSRAISHSNTQGSHATTSAAPTNTAIQTGDQTARTSVIVGNAVLDDGMVDSRQGLLPKHSSPLVPGMSSNSGGSGSGGKKRVSSNRTISEMLWHSRTNSSTSSRSSVSGSARRKSSQSIKWQRFTTTQQQKQQQFEMQLQEWQKFYPAVYNTNNTNNNQQQNYQHYSQRLSKNMLQSNQQQQQHQQQQWKNEWIGIGSVQLCDEISGSTVTNVQQHPQQSPERNPTHSDEIEAALRYSLEIQFSTPIASSFGHHQQQQQQQQQQQKRDQRNQPGNSSAGLRNVPSTGRPLTLFINSLTDSDHCLPQTAESSSVSTSTSTSASSNPSHTINYSDLHVQPQSPYMILTPVDALQSQPQRQPQREPQREPQSQLQSNRISSAFGGNSNQYQTSLAKSTPALPSIDFSSASRTTSTTIPLIPIIDYSIDPLDLTALITFSNAMDNEGESSATFGAVGKQRDSGGHQTSMTEDRLRRHCSSPPQKKP